MINWNLYWKRCRSCSGQGVRWNGQPCDPCTVSAHNTKYDYDHVISLGIVPTTKPTRYNEDLTIHLDEDIIFACLEPKVTE